MPGFFVMKHLAQVSSINRLPASGANMEMLVFFHDEGRTRRGIDSHTDDAGSDVIGFRHFIIPYPLYPLRPQPIYDSCIRTKWGLSYVRGCTNLANHAPFMPIEQFGAVNTLALIKTILVFKILLPVLSIL